MDVLHISAVATGALVAAVWQGAVLAAGVAVCLRLLPGMTAAARSVVWSAVLAVAVLLPFVHFGGAGVAAGSRQLQLDERISLVLACVWAALSLLRAAELLRSAWYLRGVATNAKEIVVEPSVAALLQHRRRVALCVSDEVDRPSVVGFLAPRIILPSTLIERLSGAELEQIVLHEMEHLRRGDDWTNLLQKLSLVVFPLNPVLVWVERRLCLERELACDDQVMRATKARKAYAACLANLAEHSMVRRGVSLALGAWERQPELVRRVHRILARSRHEMGRRQVAAAVGVMIMALIMGADGLAHSPELVSFAPMAGTAEAGVALPAPMSQGRDMGHPDGAGLMGGHVTLANAVMPERRAEEVLKHRRMRRTVRSVAQPFRIVRRVGVSSAMQRTDSVPTLVLVDWREVDGQDGAPIVQTLGFSYAAVPVRNGWLVFQL